MFVKFMFKWEGSPLSFIIPSSVLCLDHIIREESWNQSEFYKFLYGVAHLNWWQILLCF